MRAPLLIAAAFIAFTPALAAADPYPPEVREAFLKECIGGGGPPKTCQCTLQKLEATFSVDDLANEDIPEDTLTQYVTDCLGSTGDLADAIAEGLKDQPAAPAGEAAPNSFGPSCKAYFAAVHGFCDDAAVPDMVKAACPQWLDSLKQMESVLSLPGVTQDVVNGMEGGCQSGADAVQQSRAALKGIR
jgi:hypothetical protein